MKKIYNILVSILILIIIWYMISLVSNSLFLPTPLEIIVSFFTLLTKLTILMDISATLMRMFIGLGFATIIGVPLGLFFGYYTKYYDLFEFPIDFLRSIPPPTLFPLFMLLFGIGNASKIAPIVFACSFYILINTMYGVRNVKKLRIKVGKIWKMSGIKMFTNIIFPESLPYIAAGLRLAISLSLILSIVFEMFAGTKYGIGQRILDFQLLYDIPEMYAMILIAGILGYTINNIFIYIEKKTIHWSGK